MEPGDGTSGVADERYACRVQHGRQPFEPSGGRGQAVGQRGELAGVEREQPVADEVDPVERVPRVIAQIGLGEAGGGQFAEEQVPVDRVVGRQIGHRLELGAPALPERESLRAPGRGQVRPAVVVGVLADRGREGRVEPEELGQEGVHAALEVGHPPNTPMSVRSSRKSQPRASPGSTRRTVPPRSSS